MITFDAPADLDVACPTTAALESGLILNRVLGHPGLLRVTERRFDERTSTFPVENVTVDDGSTRRVLFCKHGRAYVDPYGGVRRGVPYEAMIYDRVIKGQAVVPTFLGSFSGSHGTTLILEHIPRAASVTDLKYTSDGPLAAAVAELARWHRHYESIIDLHASLNEYRERHLALWIRKARRVNDESLRGAFDPGDIAQVARRLALAPSTLVHGELFPANALIADGRICFVDWESAGVGPGEIDLAALTSGGWPEAVERELEDLYASTRWPQGPPHAFGSAVAAARAYIVVSIAWHTSRDVDGDGDGDATIADQARSALQALRMVR
jgi:hypothetical protein